MLNDDSDEESKTSGGCCSGWFGLKFIINKISGIVVDDPNEAWTAGIN